MRLADRLVLGYVWPALAAAAIVEASAWYAFGAPFGLIDGAFTAGLALCLAYGAPVRNGELAALQSAGRSPGRIAAPVTALALAIALSGAALASIVEHPPVRTQYAGYVLTALQLPLMASLALPVAARASRRDPWAAIALLLIGYVVVHVGLKIAGSTIGWAPGLETFFADAALIAADIALYRQISRPRQRP